MPSKLISKRTSRSETYYQLSSAVVFIRGQPPPPLRQGSDDVSCDVKKVQVASTYCELLQYSFLLMVQFHSWMLHQFMNRLLARQNLRPVFIYTAYAYLAYDWTPLILVSSSYIITGSVCMDLQQSSPPSIVHHTNVLVVGISG